MEKHQQKQGDTDGPPKKKGNRGGDANTNQATIVGNTGPVAPSATQVASSEQGATSAQKNRRLGGVDVAPQSAAAAAAVAALLPPSDGKRADEEAPPPSPVREQEGEERVVVVDEAQKPPELTGSREKCPW